jgi:integrase
MALNHTQLQALRPREKAYKVNDRDGLFIEVQPTGTMTWRYQYWLDGKREKLTIGRYPEIGLADARRLRDDAASLLALGQSPAKKKQSDKVQRRIAAASASTVEQLAERWYAEDVAHQSESWRYSVRRWLTLDIYPAIGKLRPADVTTDAIDALVGSVVARGSPSSAGKVRMICSKVFAFAVDRRELQADPVARARTVKTPDSKSHRPLAVREIKPFLDALEADSARLSNKLAIRLLMLTLTRKSELCTAKWAEIDLENAIWDIPAHRMGKNGLPHRVYLARQAVEILHQLKTMAHGGDYVLPNMKTLSKPIGHTTLNNVIDRLDIQGGRFVPHGFRHTASTMLNEMGYPPDVIERQLAHKDQNKVRAVYNQSEYADQRRNMLQEWADYIDALKAGSNVIPLNARRRAA